MTTLHCLTYFTPFKKRMLLAYFIGCFLFSGITHALTSTIPTPNTADTIESSADSVKAKQNNWHVYLQAPKQQLWQGQASQWLVISINPPTGKVTFDLPQSEEFSLLKSSPIAVNDGKKTGWAYPVKLIAKKSGTLTIPVFTLRYPLKSLTTVSQTVLVKKPTLSDRMQLDISLNQDDIYLGQSVRLTTSWTVDYPISALKSVNLHLPAALLNDTLSIVQPWNKADENSKKSIGLPVNGMRQIAHWQTLPNNQLRIYFDTVIKPTAVGQYHLSPATLLASVENKLAKTTKKKFKGSQYLAYYNNQFFEPANDQQPSQQVFTQSANIVLNVKALPANAPSHFSGIIGRPIIESSVLPEQIKQGEPAQYNLTIVHPDIETLTLPSLSENPSFMQSFNVPSPATISFTGSGSKTISQSLFPRRADIPSIPAKTLNYFELETGLYRDMVIESVPIVVTENDNFSFSDIESNKNIRLKNQLTPDNEGVWAMRWQKKVTNKAGKDTLKSTAATNPWLWLFLLLTPPLIVCALLLGQLHKRLQQQRAMKPIYQLKQALQQKGDPLLCLSRYCYARLGLAPSQFNADNIKKCIAPYFVNSPNSSASAFGLSQWLEQYQTRYAQQSTQLSTQEIAALLIIVDNLEKCLPRFQHNTVSSHNKSSANSTKNEVFTVPKNTNFTATVICLTALVLSANSNQAYAETVQTNAVPMTTKLRQANLKDIKLHPTDITKKAVPLITINSLHLAHQKALQQSMNSPHKAHIAHATIAQQLTNFIDDSTVNQASLLYDIGTSWYHAGRYGQSVLWLRRAEITSPDDAIIQHNLAQARNKRLDQLPDNFAPQWLNQLHNLASQPLWLIFCWLAYLLFWLAVWRRFTARDLTNKHFYLALIIVCLAGLSQLARSQFKPSQSQAVVTSQDVISRKGPGLIFSPAFTTPLHEGTELIVQRSDGQWSEVKLSNNTICWLPTRAFTNINITAL